MLLSAVEAVDRVVIFNELDAGSMIRRIRPQIVVKGKRFLNKQLPEKKAIEEHRRPNLNFFLNINICLYYIFTFIFPQNFELNKKLESTIFN
ncbi:MAG: hypothetical protein Ct9H300mP28_17900 [Pseudomonadota bacterium]|nr:MAG: hypothetical protein Ct9H300mP28_17900 [Pseudomonadota bacterium]